MHTFGPVSGVKTGRQVKVVADGDYSGAKSWGISLAPALLVTNATGAPITLVDDTVIPPGVAYFRFGQILCRCTAGVNLGFWGPYDPASAADGRNAMRRGQCGFLDETWFDAPGPLGFTMGTQHPAVYEWAKKVWKQRLLITAGAASLAAGPTIADFEAAFPDLHYVYG
jgi:hypothetical protein